VLRPPRTGLIVGAVVAAVVAGGGAFSRLGQDGGGQRGGVFSPEVRHTGQPPTGYKVTFRFRDRRASSVVIEGEWYFSSPSQTRVGFSQGLLPAQWKPADFAIGWPNVGASAGWPMIRMKEDRRTGVWSYTTPLPSGVFNYDFVVDCTPDELENGEPACTPVSDPSNPPWNQHGELNVGSIEPTSQVYVPSDPKFHTVDYSWQARASPRGALKDVRYDALVSGSASSPGFSQLAVYTPPGYDPHRPKSYPTLYLSAGYDGNEVDWSTRADAANILDNLIDSHRIKPLVAVMTNFLWDDCANGDASRYDQNLIGWTIPYVQSHYNVSKQASQRAFGGLSCGGGFAGSLLVDHPREFGAVALMSPTPANTVALSAAQAKAIRAVRVMIGGGLQDALHPSAETDVLGLRSAGVRPFTDFINGGHDWNVWRVMLRDFLTRVASPGGAGASAGIR
jgi:enterochelin esterase-like enzyme